MSTRRFHPAHSRRSTRAMSKAGSALRSGDRMAAPCSSFGRRGYALTGLCMQKCIFMQRCRKFPCKFYLTNTGRRDPRRPGEHLLISTHTGGLFREKSFFVGRFSFCVARAILKCRAVFGKRETDAKNFGQEQTMYSSAFSSIVNELTKAGIL